MNPEQGSLVTFVQQDLTMFLKRILHYINPANLFRKSDSNINLRMMHGINKISLWMFIVCLVIMLIRFLS